LINSALFEREHDVNDMADGLNMQPRIGEPETSGASGRSFPGPELTAGGPQALLAPNIPDTSGPGPTPLQQPGAWSYDFNPADGVARATFNGEVIPSGGGGPGAVTSWNTRTGDVTLLLTDITAAGGAPIASPVFTGNPAAPTRLAGDSSGGLATTAFVQQAITANVGVSSFNARTGAVTLSTADITGAGGAPLASPALTGAPTAPTASLGDTSNQIATDAFVSNAIAGGSVTTWNGRRGAVVLTLSDVQSVGGAPIASPNFTGTPSGPTPTVGDATTRLATTAFVTNAISAGTAGVASFNTRTGAVTLTPADIASAGGAPLLSPAFTGTPTAPTPTAGDSTTKIATTAYVETAIGSLPAGVSTWNGRTGTVTLALSDVTSVGGAPLAAPVFTGAPAAPTPPALDNSTRLATTGFVTAALPVASTTTPLMDGTAAVGNGTTWARSNHVHPTDTSRYSATNPSGFQTAAQVTASLANYVPLAGNAIVTGPLTLEAGASPNALSLTIGAGNVSMLALYDTAGGNNRSDYYFDHTNGQTVITNNIVVTSLNLDGGGAFIYAGGTGNAVKVGGGSWTAASDDRIKTVLGDYAIGLDEVLAMRPVEFVYKGNDTPTAELGRSTGGVVEPYAGAAPFPASPHFTVATNETPFVGFIAQELEAICPGMVTQTAAFIDGEAVADLRNVDVSNLVFALINAVKTLAARVEVLEGA
jgi:Chaperone of endosialidase